MSQGAYVTLVGFVAQDPTIRTTATGKQLSKVRVGTTPRYRDGEAGQWRDGATSGPDEILDEDAIEQFGRDLENDELAARAAAENEENENEDEAGVPAVSATPF